MIATIIAYLCFFIGIALIPFLRSITSGTFKDLIFYFQPLFYIVSMLVVVINKKIKLKRLLILQTEFFTCYAFGAVNIYIMRKIFAIGT